MIDINYRELLIYIFLWLSLIVLWNFGYQQATPLMDVIAAVVILIITKIALKIVSKKKDRKKSDSSSQ